MSTFVHIPILKKEAPSQPLSLSQHSFPNAVSLLGSSTQNPFENLQKSTRRLYDDVSEKARKPYQKVLESIKKTQYLDYANEVSYAMQGVSTVQSGIRQWEKVRDVFQSTPGSQTQVDSYLGGKFLRMYLEHKTDPGTIRAAGEEIKRSDKFATLTKDLQTVLQKTLTVAKASDTDIRQIATAFLNHERQKKATKNDKGDIVKGGIVFGGGLNVIVGGITGLEVSSVQTKTLKEKEAIKIYYTVLVKISDAYEFDNDRSQYPDVDAYRHKLAFLLKSKQFSAFEDAYQNEVLPWRSHKTAISKVNVFASYMYALEQANYTPGPLPWSVLLPVKGTVVLAIPSKTSTLPQLKK